MGIRDTEVQDGSVLLYYGCEYIVRVTNNAIRCLLIVVVNIYYGEWVMAGTGCIVGVFVLQ